MDAVIVVVEGPSAAGKTTWARRMAPDDWVAENRGLTPPEEASVAEVAAFWATANARRWSAALATEDSTGVAVCDTDPLKLHYHYCLARVGAASWEPFEIGVEVAAAALRERRLGIADVIVVEVPDDAVLADRRRGDRSRRRRNFELHRRLGPALGDWYAALDHLDPGRVVHGLPDELPAEVHRERYDEAVFRAWMSSLPRDVSSEIRP